MPSEIVWREKQQFDEGSGVIAALDNVLARFMPKQETLGYVCEHSEASLRSHEEAVYHKLFFEAYEDPTSLLPNVARWADRPVLIGRRPASFRTPVEGDSPC